MPDLLTDGHELDEETIHIVPIFVGVMFGAAGAGKLLSQVAEKLSKEVATRLPRQALTKWGLYTLSKEISKWIGIKLTKDNFARALSKAVPLVGAAKAFPG